MTLTRTWRRAFAAVAAAALLAAGTAVASSAAAPSAARAEEGDVGWVRFAHLSPDTPPVDVRFTPLSGAGIFMLHVGAGSVTPYRKLAAATYTVSVLPSGAAAPSRSLTVTVDAKAATTIVASGPSTGLGLASVGDDLTPPSPGAARIRLVQASTTNPEVDVTAADGTPVARDLEAGEATGYAEVASGPWTLRLDGDDGTGSAVADVTADSIISLFVLDAPGGEPTILPVNDSATVAW